MGKRMASGIRWLRRLWYWRRHRSERCCLNCHFLVDKRFSGYELPVVEWMRKKLWDKLTRSDPRRMTEDILGDYKCHKGFWEMGSKENRIENRTRPGSGLSEQAAIVWDSSEVIIERGEDCFFYSHMEGRHLSVVEELERRAADRREGKRDRRLVKIGVWIAAIALILNLGWSIWEHFNPPKTGPQRAAMSATQPDPPSSP